LCGKQQKYKVLLTSAVSCRDITDTAGNSEEQTSADISNLKTGLPKQPKLTSCPENCIDDDYSRARRI